MESIALHNALMLLGEESSSNGRQRVKKEGKKSKAGAAAKLGNKSKKAAGQKIPAVKVREHLPSKGIQPVLCVLVFLHARVAALSKVDSGAYQHDLK